MENKQTAMQELIYWLKSGWKDENIDTVLKKANQLLGVEWKQIDKAYFEGLIDGMNNKHQCYYMETYGNFVYYDVYSDVNSDVNRLLCDCEPHTFYEWEKDENKCCQCGKAVYDENL